MPFTHIFPFQEFVSPHHKIYSITKYPTIFLVALVFLASGLSDVQATPITQTFNFTHSNTFDDNTYNFATLTIEADNVAGTVKFTVAPTAMVMDGPNILYTLDSHGGIALFGFNTTLYSGAISTSDIGVGKPITAIDLPSDWTLSFDSNGSLYGRFGFVGSGNGVTIQNPLEITIHLDDPADATIANFLQPSSQNAYFVARVQRLTVDPNAPATTSHFIAVPADEFDLQKLNTAPVPPSAILMGIGLAGFFGMTVRRRLQKAKIT